MLSSLEDPCSGSAGMVDYLAREGFPIRRLKRVRKPMRRMVYGAIYQKHAPQWPGDPSERVSLPGDLKEVQGSGIRFGATDITYIAAAERLPSTSGCLDLFSRHVTQWENSTGSA